MKNLKNIVSLPQLMKIRLSLTVFSLIGITGFWWLGGAVYALTSAPNVTLSGFKFISQSTISGTVNGNVVSFYDNASTDSTRNYQPQNMGADYCNYKTGGNQRWGINIDKNTDLKASSVAATIGLGYVQQNGNSTDCIQIPAANISPSSNLPIANSDSASTARFVWSDINIVSADGNDKYAPTTSSGKTPYINQSNVGTCEASGIIILSDPSHGKLYSLGGSTRGVASNVDGSIQNYLKTPGQCRSTGNQDITVAGPAPNNSVNGTPTSSTTGSGSSGASSSSPGAGDACAQSNVFAWLICPMLDVAQAGSNALINLFESQLSFTVQDLGQGSGGSNSVHTAWSIIRTISSIALVVVMLIMVLSQATSWGSIDAYTVRKMLPRLVVAVILIQVSWNMFGFMLTVVNDVSKGLADLMYYPFGGSANMDLGSLLNNAHIGTGGANSDAWAVGMLGIAGFGLILGVASAPAVLAFVVTAVFALLTGLVSLMFRKILIIACLIFSPLALLLWILPGTQKYWKVWWDNFTKALMMFPIVVAIVASGRIFAYVAGTQNTSAHFSVLLNFIIVMVGYFGPLFILPKTFKWGGSLMNSAGSTIQSTVKPLSDMSSKGAHGIGERWQGERAKKYDPGAKSPWTRAYRRVQSGHMIPSARSQRLAIQAGDKWSGEEDEMALALLKRKGEKSMSGMRTKMWDKKTGRLQKFSRDANGNMLTKDGKITTDKDEAHLLDAANEADLHEDDFKELSGVAAMKQTWVDIIGDKNASKQEKKMAARQLTATSSWPEIQNSFTSEGKRVTEYDDWNDSITTSPEDYPRVLRSRVDQAPHVKNAAKKDAARRAAELGISLDSPEGRDLVSAEQILYSVEKQASNEDFATQSDGYWEEMNRVSVGADGQLTAEGQKIQEALAKRFAAIQQAGPTARQQMLGHMADGGNLQNWLNEMGIDILQYLGDPRSQGGGGGGGGTRTIERQSTGGDDGTTIHVDHEGA